VVETNIHYPTESTLIRDGLRKMLGLCVELAAAIGAGGWRQHEHLHKNVKRLSRQIDRIAARKGNNYKKRLKGAYRELLTLADTILTRAEKLQKHLKRRTPDVKWMAIDAELSDFIETTRLVCGTARRRVIEDEDVSNSEKLFSIFEPHTQLYKRGKAGKPMQFGRQVLIYEDGAGFITHMYLMPRDADDRDVVVKQTRIVQKRHQERIRCASFDRGFHSPENQKELAKLITHPCLPMPGKNQAKQQEEEATIEFRQARQHHPGVESAIGALQSGNGLVRCRDRTEVGFERYNQLGVLGRNLHVLGRIVIARENADCLAAQSRRRKVAA
jgi:hypothetical protein